MIALGCDHGGYELKKEVIKYLQEKNIEFKDYGCDSLKSVDYPTYAKKVAEAIVSGECEKGILICKSGHGMCIAVNKYKGIRGSLANTADSIINGTRDDDLNMLCLSSNDIEIRESLDIIAAFLVTEFLDEGNYRRRKEKVIEIENRNFK